MCVVLAITNTTNSKINLIECKDMEDALCRMEAFYQNLYVANQVDYNNTYLDRNIRYAQIINGLTQIELRIGILN